MNSKAVIAFLIASFLAFELGYGIGPTTEKTIFQGVGIDSLGRGQVVDFQLTSTPGSGSTFVKINGNFYEQDTQESINRARIIAEKYLGKRLSQDVFIELKGEERINGGSAGLEFALALVANDLGTKIRDDVVASAFINEDYSFGPVGGIEEKIQAAIASHKTAFLVSEDQPIKYEDSFKNQIKIVRINDFTKAVAIALE